MGMAEPMYRIKTAQTSLVVRFMKSADIPDVARLYRSIQIDRERCAWAFDPESETSFSRRGGMFLIHNEESLNALLDAPNEFFWVARDAQGTLRGSFWCGLDDAKYHRPETIRETVPGAADEVCAQMRQGTAYFSKEIIVHATKDLAECFFLIAMRRFLAKGYAYTWGEVYRACWYDDGTGRQAIDMINEASFRMLLRTGCVHVGAFAPFLIHADGFDVSVAAQILRWRLSESVQILAARLKARGTSITEEEA